MKRLGTPARMLLPLLVATLVIGATPTASFAQPRGPATPLRAPTAFSISTNPALDPAFNPSIHYYVVRCTALPTTTLSTAGSGGVSIGDAHMRSPATVSVPLVAGQAVQVRAQGQSYTIRCLPADFPAYTTTENGVPQGNGFLVAPYVSGSTDMYVIAFDANDVPVWWERQTFATNPEFFSGSTIGWWTGSSSCGGGCGTGQYNIQTLSGRPLVTVGGGIDLHDFQKISGNRYLATMYVPGRTADLSSWGLSSSATVTDGEVVELNSKGQIVWSWSALAHIDPATANVNWRNQYPDVFHINAAQMVGNQVIVSFRHLDTVYDIDVRTGDIIWQLGGVPTSKSLTVVGDSTFDSQAYPQLFSGQHDAKLLPDGTLTVHDNASLEGVPSRALRFQIDPTTMTATVLEDVTDANHAFPAPCCGSVAKLATGDWIVDWGLGSYVAELTPSGATVNQISYPGSSYRVSPVTATDRAMSKGMDAMVRPLKLG